jgi:hypothetical protein
MNFTKVITLLFSIVFFLSCEEPAKIEGKWHVEKFQNKNGEFKKSSNKWVEFFTDGTLIGGKEGESEIKNGVWEYDSINNTLTIESKKKYSDNGTQISLKKALEKGIVFDKEINKRRIFFIE